MTWLLLFGLTAFVVLLPMLPAIVELWWPSDVMPLPIDTRDALDPPFLARSFAARLAAALAADETRLGRSSIAAVPPRAEWPLDAAERRVAISQRVWHAVDDAELPRDISFLSEVAAHGTLHTAAGGLYRALWAGRQLTLAPDSHVLRWAHGDQVDVGAGCRLSGRVTADDSITVRADTSFTLLHAPTVRFVPTQAVAASTLAAVAVPAAQAQGVFRLGLPDAVVWDATASRGICAGALDVGAHRAWRGDLVCHADLWLGTGCNAHGSLKAHGDITAAAGSSVAGSVVAQGSITLEAACTVRGSVISETSIVLGTGCVVGAPGHPATVAAPSILVAPGVVVHGTLWAGASGRMQGDGAVQAVAEPNAVTAPAREAFA